MVTTAIIMGFAGSLHCVGMCSPLVMAVSNLNSRAWWTRLVYNLGRILTYGVLGGIVGFIGMAFPLSKYQNLVSIILGVLLLLFALTGMKSVRIPVLTALLQRFSTLLKSRFAYALTRRGYTATFLMGTFNGVLPCGLSFIALAYSLTLNSPSLGFVYMILFGVGTLPVMMGLTAIANSLIRKLNLSLQKVTTTLLFVSGCLLIVRVFLVHYGHAGPEDQGMIDIILCR